MVYKPGHSRPIYKNCICCGEKLILKSRHKVICDECLELRRDAG